MQTFLPVPSFAETAAILDYRRLGKQRVEVVQILKALTGQTKGWRNHPAATMWRGCEYTLGQYGIAMCQEWLRRGYVDNMLPVIKRLAGEGKHDQPAWLGEARFHAAHRSNLLRKDADYYRKFGWLEPADLPYVWPK